MTRPTISGVSPFFIVADVPATLAFYRDMLGFEIVFRGPDPDDEFFGIVRRDGATIMFKALGVILDGKEVLVEPVPNYKRKPAFSWDAYFVVPDPDALAAEFASRGVLFSVPLGDGDGLRGFVIEDLDLLVGQPIDGLKGGRPRAVQDLVRERAADPGEEARIRQRALERVALAEERGAEVGERGVEDLDPARVERREVRLAADEVEPRAPLRPRLDEEERAGREVERGETPLPRDRPAGLGPPEPARDHQVDHEEEPALEPDSDPFADAAQLGDRASLGLLQRRVPRAERDRADAHRLEGRSEDPGVEGVEIRGDLRELRHPAESASTLGGGKRSKRRGRGTAGIRRRPAGSTIVEVPRSRAGREGARVPRMLRSAALPLRPGTPGGCGAPRSGTPFAPPWKA